MSKVAKPSYKYCVVPLCKSTTFKTPEKVFFSVPRDPLKRKRWYNAMKRGSVKGKQMSCKSCLYCCEDHFSLEDDMENYWQFQLSKNVRRLKLKTDVVPHRFICQQKKNKPAVERKYIAKKKRSEVVKQCISDMESSLIVLEEDMVIHQEIEESSSKEKNIQVCIKPSYRSKALNTTVVMITTASSPIKTHKVNVCVMTSPEKIEVVPDIDYFSSDFESEPDMESSNYSSDKEIQNLVKQKI